MITDKLKTAVIAVPLIILIVNWSSVSFFIAVLAVITLGLLEFYKLMEDRGYYAQKIAGVMCGLCLSLAIFIFERRVDVRITGVVLTVFLFLFFVLSLIRGDAYGGMVNVSMTLLGIFYVPWTISHSILLRDMRPYGRSFIYLLLFSIWSINMVMNWMRKKTTAEKRRAKTGVNPYARFAAATVAGVVIVLVWQKILGLEYFRMWAVNMEFLSVFHSIIIGLILGISSQVGCIINSLIKTNVDTKDSGKLFPGHGSMLDNICGFQFSIPLMYYYVRFIVI